MKPRSMDREIADAQRAVGLKCVAVYRYGRSLDGWDEGAPVVVLEGNGRRVLLSVMRDEEGNGAGALFVDEVAL